MVKHVVDSPDAWRSSLLLIALYLVAMVIRLTAVVSLGPSPGLDTDEIEYINAATCLSRGLGYAIVPQGMPQDSMPQRTAFRMPGPSLMMAGVISLFGENIRWLRLAAVVCTVFDRTTASNIRVQF